MLIDYNTHYDASYWQHKQTYRTPDGKEHVYFGPSLVWEGFATIADALAKVLPKGSLLDVGCGGGDLTRRLQERGFDTRGVDISAYAIENCAPDMRDRLMLADISTCPHVNGPYDVVMATDLLEHLYAEDLDGTFGLTIRWDIMYCFQLEREKHEGWKNTGGWNMPTTWFLEKK